MSVKQLNTEAVLGYLTTFCKQDRGIISADLSQQGSERLSSNISKKSIPPPKKKILVWKLFGVWFLFFTPYFSHYIHSIFFPSKSVPLSMNKEHLFCKIFSLLPYFPRLLLSRKKKTQKMVIFQTKPKLFSLHCEWSPWPTELSSCLWKSSTLPMLKIQFSSCCLLP